MVQLTPTGEIMNLSEADQFQPGKSQFECGFFACAMVRSAAPPGHAPQRTVQQTIDNAESWYAQYNGSDDISNLYGMTLDQLYQLIQQMTYGYIPIDLGNDPMGFIKGWLRNGYPVIVAADETTFHDMELGGAVPYPWTPSGSHVIVITGIASDGNFLVRDSANCTSLYDPNSLRPGPRKYNASQLVGGLVSATAVQTYWLPKPPANFDPRSNIMPTVPNGWHDNGTTLMAPNNIAVVQGFRNFILNNPWDPANWPVETEHGANPLELSNPSLGSGTQQRFRMTTLEWTSARGVFVAWTGPEMLALDQKVQSLSQQLQSTQNANVQALQQQIQDLTTKLSSAKSALAQIANEAVTASK